MFSFGKETDINARQPNDLHYMKVIRYLLGMMCCWPHHLFGEKPLPLRYTFIIFMEAAIVFVGGIIFTWTHFTDVTFLEMGQTYLTIFLSTVCMQRATVSKFESYQQTMKEFLLEVHLFHHRHKTDFYQQTYQYIHRICTVFVTVIHSFLFFAVLLFNLTPLYNNYRKGMFNKEIPPDKTFEYSINYSVPFFNQFTELPTYIVLAIINVLFSYDAAVNFCGMDLNICVIVFHIWGHLKILDHNLRTIPTPIEMRDQKSGRCEDELSYSEEENKKIASFLTNIIDHHRMIMSFMAKTSKAFGPTLCFYFMFHQASGCILLLECSELDPNSLTRYGALTITLFQLLIQISVIVELLGSQSETLKDAVYSIPWECMNTSNRKIVLFLLYNVQEPIRLKPMGIVSIGVQTMAAILKTSFSYFMLLRTFN